MILRMMKYLLPALMVAVGVVIYFWISSILTLPKLNIIEIICVGMIPAICELLVVGRLTEKGRRLLLVEGAMFPFISAGLCVGMIII
jgi:hypothetical protein